MTSSPFRVERLNAREMTYKILKEAIVGGKFSPGGRLNESQLAEQFAVSRTPLREALQRLEQEGFVVRRPNGRLEVSPLSIAEAEELYTVRSFLEGLLTEQATRRADASDLAHLRQLAGELELAGALGHPESVTQRGEEFHDYLQRLSGNHIAARMLQTVRDLLKRYRRLRFFSDPTRAAEGGKEHRLICERMAAGDAEGASEAMRLHIEKSKEAVIRALQQAGIEQPENKIT